jgi:hypothetical protein
MRTRRPSFVASVLVLAVIAAGCSGDDSASGTKKTTTTETERTTTTEAATSTTAPPPPVAPLTGLPVTGDQGSRMGRPALAVKIDNSPEALPQSGVNNTDLVFEIQVEGISRLMAVFHTNEAGKIGPTRSARYSDPPILAMFGTALFGWSGANKGVTQKVESSAWINNVNWNAYPKEYARSRDRKAPHNLYTTSSLFQHARPGEGPPPTLFQYLAPGEGNASATPVAGVNEQVGTTKSAWVWNPTVGQYLRWEYGKRHGTTDAGQVWANNVVILDTQYTPGPVAVTVGAGKALVLTGGVAVPGVWSRADQSLPYTLTANDGSPIKISPGRTWVELPNHPYGPMPPELAAGLLAGR